MEFGPASGLCYQGIVLRLVRAMWPVWLLLGGLWGLSALLPLLLFLFASDGTGRPQGVVIRRTL